MQVVAESPRWEYEFTCHDCKAQLLADADDVMSAVDEGVYWYYVRCPECGVAHRLDEHDLNTKLKKKAEKKGNDLT